MMGICWMKATYDRRFFFFFFFRDAKTQNAKVCGKKSKVI